MSEEWRYLGVDFCATELKNAGESLETELDRITRASPKPQQRLKILRCIFTSSSYHKLFLGRVSLGKLKALDKQARVAIKR